MWVMVFKMRSVSGRGRESWSAERPDGGRPLPGDGEHLDFQSVEGGRPQIGNGQHIMIRRQYLGLGDNAVGEAVLSALRGHLRPRHLKPSHGLMEVALGHLPGKVARDVHVVDDEGGRKVLGLG